MNLQNAAVTTMQNYGKLFRHRQSQNIAVPLREWQMHFKTESLYEK